MPTAVELKHVTRTYKMGDETLRALDDVTLSVNPGDFIAITGPSGSGKSTLANVIGGLDIVDNGNVLVDGLDLAHLGDRELSHYRNHTVGFVFQSFNLQPTATALENVMLPLMFSRVHAKERRARATAALTAVGLSERLKHKPTELSGGQRQRVAIARALATKPSIIIADEPTGNLDSERGREIMLLLQGLNKQGITLIIITHDMTVAAMASRILHIKDGKLSERAK